MPSQKPRIVTRVDNELYEKFQIIAKQEKRTLSKQGEYIIEQYIQNYEKQNGEIEIFRKEGENAISKT